MNAATTEAIARAVLADKSSPPVALLAAWHYVHGWKRDWLPDLLAAVSLSAAAPGEPA